MNEQNEPQGYDPSVNQSAFPTAAPTWQPGEASIPPVESSYAYPNSYPMAQPVKPGRATGSRWWIAALVLATALISSGLSAAGSYLVYDANFHSTTVKLIGAAPIIAPTEDSNGDAVIPVSLTVSQDVIKVAAAVAPSIVTITTTGTASNGLRSTSFVGSGSGFVVSANGLIVTNNHVVAGTNSLTVALSNGRTYPATVVKTDPVNDLALVSIKASGLVPVSLGASASVRVGQLAIAVGNPEGTFAETVTSGIISGMDRSISVGDSSTGASEELTGLLQTDAAINPGNSGGPLLDANAAVVGVVTASSANAQGIGFAIPVDKVKALISSVGAGS